MDIHTMASKIRSLESDMYLKASSRDLDSANRKIRELTDKLENMEQRMQRLERANEMMNSLHSCEKMTPEGGADGCPVCAGRN